MTYYWPTIDFNRNIFQLVNKSIQLKYTFYFNFVNIALINK